LSSQTENQPDAASARPTLLSGDTLARADSILLGIEKSKALRAELDKAAAPKSAFAGLPWILGVSGVLAAGALWWVMGSGSKSDSFDASTVEPKPAVTAAVASRPLGVVQTAAMPSLSANPSATLTPNPASPAAAAASAVIAGNSASPAAAAMMQAATTAPLALATAAAAGVPSAIVAATQTPKPAVVRPPIEAEAKGVAVPVKTTAVKPKSKSKPRPKATVKSATKLASTSPSSKSPGAAAAGPAAAVASSATTASKQRDPDTELVTAILDGADNGARNNAAAAGASAADSGVRSPKTIAGLVSNCTANPDKAAGLTCRQQICDGYWGKAQACPKELAPGAAVAKKAVKGKVKNTKGNVKQPVVKKAVVKKPVPNTRKG
jgi:hypothetical protein